jgi:hypothetical protein
LKVDADAIDAARLAWSLLPGEAMQRGPYGTVDSRVPGCRLGLCVYAQARSAMRTLDAARRQRFTYLTQSGVMWRNVPPKRRLVSARVR